jgi:hypothetical protein
VVHLNQTAKALMPVHGIPMLANKHKDISLLEERRPNQQ